MKKLLAILIPAIVFVAAIVLWQRTRTQEDATREKTLRYAFEVETTILDPSRISDAYASRVMDQVFEGLVALNENNEIVPAVAEKWRSEQNGKHWIFTLRKDVKFHSSDIFGPEKTRALEAADVEFSFTRLLGPGSTSGYAIDNVLEGASAFAKGEAKAISGIQVINPNEIAFDLIAPDPLFPQRLSSVILAIVPKEAGQLPEGKVFGKDVIIGTGPFRVTSRTDTAVELRRNKDYWHPTQGNVDKVEVKVIKNDALRLAAAKSGEVDIAYVPLLLAPTIAEQDGKGYSLKGGAKGSRLEVHQTLNSTFLGLNCERLDPAFRTALAKATDRTALAKVFLAGTTTPSVGPVPLSIPGYREPIDASAGPNVVAARQALQESASRDRMPFEILVHEKEGSEQVGQLLQAQFKAAGIDSKITKLEYGTVIQRMVSGEYDACVMSFEYVYSTPGPILEGLLNSARIPAPNFWRFRSPEVDAALKEFQQTADPKQSNALASRIVGMIQEAPPTVYLYQTLTPVLTSGRVEGVPVNGHSVPMLWMVEMN